MGSASCHGIVLSEAPHTRKRDKLNWSLWHKSIVAVGAFIPLGQVWHRW